MAEFAWLFWPVAMIADMIVSNRCIEDSWSHRSRWALRILHSLTLASVAMIFEVEFFWLCIINIHYHGGWEVLVIGPLVLYVSIRLAQRLDRHPTQSDATGIHSTVPLWFSGASAVLLLLACVNSATRNIPFMTDREPILVFLVPFLTLISAGSLSRCSIRRPHMLLNSSLAVASFFLIAVFFVATGFKFFGFLPWGCADDDPWFYALTGLICFTILSITSILRRKVESNNPSHHTAYSHSDAVASD